MCATPPGGFGGSAAAALGEPVRHGLADEARRYLAAVDVFRSEGMTIDWRAEPHVTQRAGALG